MDTMPRNTSGDDPHFQVNVSRRTFAKTVGSMAAIGAAVDPAKADELRDTRRVTAENTDDDIPPLRQNTFSPENWSITGPFMDQSDPTVGWLEPVGSENEFGTGERIAEDDQRFQSGYAAGSTITWAETMAEDHNIEMDFAARIDPENDGGILSPSTWESWYGDNFDDAAGYAFATFEMDKPQRAAFQTDGASAWLNGHRIDRTPHGVILQEGTNYLLIKTSLNSSGQASLWCRFRRPRAPVEVNYLRSFRQMHRNVVMPDLVKGEQTDRPASIRVTNYAAETINDATLTVAEDHDYIETETVEIDPPLAPFETRRINTRIVTNQSVPEDDNGLSAESEDSTDSSTDDAKEPEIDEEPLAEVPAGDVLDQLDFENEGEDDDVSTSSHEGTPWGTHVIATIAASNSEDSREIPLRVKGTNWLHEGDGRFVTTFTSEIDESVQYLAYRPPGNIEESNGPYRMIVTLHGAGVNAFNMTTPSYGNRDDTFVLAPDCRGPANYNHEHTGRLDDLEALEKMKEWFNIDENQIYLTGHSMGGHGAFFVGLTHPGKWAGVAPSAGWIDRRTYSSGVVTHGRDKLHTGADLTSVKERAFQNSMLLPKTENAADGTLPFFILHGGRDWAVPSVHSRMVVRALSYQGLTTQGEVGERYSTPDSSEIDVAYLEVPMANHWWDVGAGPGSDVVNHPDMIDNFLFSATREPYPEHVRFYTTNLRVENSKYWVEIDEQYNVHKPTWVNAQITEDGISLNTENVAVMSFDPRVFQHSSVNQTGQPTLHVSGESVKIPGRDGEKRIWVDFRGGISVSRTKPESQGLRKTPEQYGPINEAFYSPYRLVYGTQGNDEETALNRNLANLTSHHLCSEYRARSPAIVIPDTAVDHTLMDAYNLILYGRPSSNSVLADLQDDLPIQIENGRAAIADQTYTGDLAIKYVYPNPTANDQLVQVNSGTSIAGLRLTNTSTGDPDNGDNPDYQIYDDTVGTEAWNGCLAAGFFDKHWQVSEDLGELRNIY